VKQVTRSNDTVRIPIFILFKDQYEPNDTKTLVDAMTVGGPFCSNLSACQSVIDNLSIHREYVDDPPCFGDVYPDADYFKIYLADVGGDSDKVRITFADMSATELHDGNLAIELRNAADVVLESSDTDNDVEEISLSGYPAGTYYLKVFGRAEFGDPHAAHYNTNYYYKLELTLPAPPCGDLNGNGQVNSQDVVLLGNYLTGACDRSGTTPPCVVQGDVDGDCAITCTDLQILQDYVFFGSPFPAAACTCE